MSPLIGIALIVSTLLGTLLATAATDRPVERVKIIGTNVAVFLALAIALEIVTS